MDDGCRNVKHERRPGVLCHLTKAHFMLGQFDLDRSFRFIRNDRPNPTVSFTYATDHTTSEVEKVRVFQTIWFTMITVNYLAGLCSLPTTNAGCDRRRALVACLPSVRIADHSDIKVWECMRATHGSLISVH